MPRLRGAEQAWQCAPCHPGSMPMRLEKQSEFPQKPTKVHFSTLYRMNASSVNERHRKNQLNQALSKLLQKS
jgi:hypothetical protein